MFTIRAPLSGRRDACPMRAKAAKEPQRKRQTRIYCSAVRDRQGARGSYRGYYLREALILDISGAPDARVPAAEISADVRLVDLNSRRIELISLLIK